MSWKDIQFIKNGMYDYMKEKNCEEAYLLDSNVVMHLRNLYYSPSKIEQDEINGLLNLVEFLKDKQVIASSAIRELSWDVEKVEIDIIKEYRFNEALSGLLFDSLVKDRIASKTDSSGSRKSPKGKVRKLDSIYDNGKENLYIVGTMCILLKMYELLLTYNVHTEYRLIYKDICFFMAYELQLFGMYELILIQYMLFSNDESRRNEIRRLFKLNEKKDIKKNIWNASWDVFFMRSITAAATNYARGDWPKEFANPILITADKDLYSLTSYFISTIQFENVNGQLYPGLNFKTENCEDYDLIYSMKLTIDATREDRLRKHNSVPLHERLDEFMCIVNRIEKNINRVLSNQTI